MQRASFSWPLASPGLLMLLYVAFPILLNIFLSWCSEMQRESESSVREANGECCRLSSALQGFDFGLVCVCIVLAGLTA